jgi:hypothetical protein
LTGTSLKNSELLRDLISASHDANIAFLHHVGSLHDRDKLELFLRFHDGAYADRKIPDNTGHGLVNRSD